MSPLASLIDKILSPVFAFADRCWARDDEIADDGSRGDVFLAQQLRRHASGPHPDHTEIHRFHRQEF